MVAEFFTGVLNFILNIDTHLGEIIANYGTLSYIILFVIILAETGFVLTPFLPGDSLLFAAGAFAAVGAFDIFLLTFLMWAAAFLGDSVNYWVGRYSGQKLIDNPKIPINQEYVDRTKEFYGKYGGKTIFLARFIPIIRTFAPFIAGIAKMNYGKFVYYNAIGGLVWVFSFTLAGYFFGNIPIVKENFSLAVILIIVLSFIPILIGFFRVKSKKRKSFSNVL